MARIHPSGWRELEASGAALRELQTLARLEKGLDDQYDVFHGVHWTRVNTQNHALIGEIDFVIVSPAGKVLLIEQKTGFLEETVDGLHKRYGEKVKSVPLQMARTRDQIFTRLRETLKQDDLLIDSLLYCPDHQVRDPGSAGIDPARIIDASRRDHLIRILEGILPVEEDLLLPRAKIMRFFGDLLALVPEASAIVGEAGVLYTRLSGGLAQWARRIECSPHRLRVVGTAGSGKTQLAMAVYRDAIAAGRRPLYVCFNRPLADHVSGIVPTGGKVATYHQLGDEVLRAAGGQPDYSSADSFAEMAAALAVHVPAEAECFDELIVDEGQDFEADWSAPLLRYLQPDGRAWWLEDPLQDLYGRTPLPAEGWVTLRSDVNYRSPREVVAGLNRLLPLPTPHVPGSPIGTETMAGLETLAYADDEELLSMTVRAVRTALGLGYRREHLALVTFRGRERSVFSRRERLGPWSLRLPTGHYDLLGREVHREGDLTIDSVHRFKGRAAPCVIFTEVDFEQLDDNTVRRLFVGATRATLKLFLVLSRRAEGALLARLEAGATLRD